MTEATGDDKDDYHKLNDVANKAILQELIDGTEEEVTAQILQCYKIGASDAEIKKEFAKWRVSGLRDTAAYLRIETEGKLKADVISDIITKLESLLMELCGVCDTYYHNTLDDLPVYQCMVCQQGCHQPCYQEVFQALQALDPKHRKSMQFICSSCQRVYQPQVNTESRVQVKKSPSKTDKDSDKSLNESIDRDDDETPDKNNETPENTEICPQYKWNKCPNYEQCKFRHPPRCRDMLRDGKCRYKKKCKYHHPPLCKFSLKERKCFNKECKFFHLAKTLRHEYENKPNEENPQPQGHHPQNPRNPAPPPNQAHQPQNVPRPTSTQQPVFKDQNTDSTQNSLPFLVLMMKQLKEELLGHLGKEIAEIKESLKPAQPKESISMHLPQIATPQQNLINPLLQSMYMMKSPQSVPPQL